MEREARTLRTQVSALGRRTRGARVSPALRARIARYARAQRAAGRSYTQIAGGLGVSAESIRRWTAAGAVSSGGREFVPVRIVEAGAPRALAVVSPHGFRVEGVDLASVTALLRALG